MELHERAAGPAVRGCEDDIAGSRSERAAAGPEQDQYGRMGKQEQAGQLPQREIRGCMLSMTDM